MIDRRGTKQMVSLRARGWGLHRLILALRLRSWVALVATCLALNLVLNADYPASTITPAWFVPTWELSVVIGVHVFVAARRGRVPTRVHGCGATLILLWAVFHTIDSFYRRFFNREFRAAIDAPLLPEAWTLLVATDGLGWALTEVGIGVVTLGALSWLLYRLLKINASAMELIVSRGWLKSRSHWRSHLAVASLLAAPVILHIWPQARGRDLGPSARTVAELRFLLDYPKIRAEARARFARLGERAKVPGALDALRGRDVSLILIESYGRGAIESQSHGTLMSDALRTLHERLVARGGATASAWLLPPTYGGGSWYAHATLSTGVKVWSPLDYSLLLDSDVVPLSRSMQNYGYRTINVMPGTTRVWPEGSYYGFDELMYAWDFDYAGPWVGWGRFPDQLVLDQVRRKAVKTGRPTYKEIKLVTSHAPWRAVPPVVDDWDAIGNGDIYNALPIQRFDVKWSALEQAHAPYMATILYDLEVVGRYVQRFEQSDALIMILGDHQPLREASLSELWDVPVHIGGPADLVERFLGHGFVSGIEPGTAHPPLPMEDFMPLFLRRLAYADAASEVNAY